MRERERENARVCTRYNFNLWCSLHNDYFLFLSQRHQLDFGVSGVQALDMFYSL